MADEWQSPRLRHERAELIAQSGLSDTGLADQHDQRAVTRCGRLEHRLQLAKLALAADEWRLLGQQVFRGRPLSRAVGRWETCVRRHGCAVIVACPITPVGTKRVA